MQRIRDFDTTDGYGSHWIGVLLCVMQKFRGESIMNSIHVVGQKFLTSLVDYGQVSHFYWVKEQVVAEYHCFVTDVILEQFLC